MNAISQKAVIIVIDKVERNGELRLGLTWAPSKPGYIVAKPAEVQHPQGTASKVLEELGIGLSQIRPTVNHVIENGEGCISVTIEKSTSPMRDIYFAENCDRDLAGAAYQNLSSPIKCIHKIAENRHFRHCFEKYKLALKRQIHRRPQKVLRTAKRL